MSLIAHHVASHALLEYLNEAVLGRGQVHCIGHGQEQTLREWDAVEDHFFRCFLCFRFLCVFPMLLSQ
jgi:hypothetical protein